MLSSFHLAFDQSPHMATNLKPNTAVIPQSCVGTLKYNVPLIFLRMLLPRGFPKEQLPISTTVFFSVSSSTSPTSSSSSSASSSSNASSVAHSTASQLHHHLRVRQLHHLHHLYHVFVKSYQALATSCIATFAWENKRLGYEQIQHLICDMTWVSHDAKWMYCKQRHMETPRLAANFSQQRLKANVNASKKTQMLSGWSMRQGRTGRVPLLARFFKNHCQLHFWNLHANLCGVHVVFSLWFILWSSIVYGHPSLRVADFAQFRLAVALKLLRLGFHHLI